MRHLAMVCVVCLVPLVSAAQSKQFASKPLEITDVTVIDTTGAPAKPGQSVVVVLERGAGVVRRVDVNAFHHAGELGF